MEMNAGYTGRGVGRTEEGRKPGKSTSKRKERRSEGGKIFGMGGAAANAFSKNIPSSAVIK